MAQENSIINRKQRPKIKAIHSEEETQYIDYPCGLPGEIWARIADCLGTQDLGRFAQTCKALQHVLSVCEGKVLKTWFRELKAQCQGEGAEEAINLLNYCEQNIRNQSALLALINGLLREAHPHRQLELHENDVERDINALTQLVYPDPQHNPRNILKRSLISLIENGDHLIARSEVIIKRDKAFNDRFRTLRYSGIGLMAIGVSLIILLKNLTALELHKSILIPVILPSAALISAPLWKNTGLVERYRNRGFWKIIDEMPAEELQRLPTLRHLREEHRAEYTTLKNTLSLGARLYIASIAFSLFCVLMLYTLSKMMLNDENLVPQTKPPGP